MVLVWCLVGRLHRVGDSLCQEEFKRGCLLSHFCIILITLEAEYAHRIYIL